MKTLSSQAFQKLILGWFDRHGRKNLPWQQNKTPYRVWVSEIMLQQTQVTTVIDYFHRFMQRFADIYSLASAEIDEVLHLWTGLGYYTRARNLHRTAQIICQNYAGEFPADQTALEELPGIGRSTAGAILAIGFQKSAAILDGNVKRVLTRLHAIQEWPGDKKVTDTLWQIAENLTPTHRIADYTQALMDMGATLCTRSKPLCRECPLQKHCQAYAQDKVGMLPKAKPRKTLPIKQSTFLMLQKNNTVLLEKRPPFGIWGGLWSLPEITGCVSSAEIKQFCRQRFGLVVDKIQTAPSFRHTFSHFHLEIFLVTISFKKNTQKVLEAGQQIWYNMLRPEAIGLPQPVKLLLQTGVME